MLALVLIQKLVSGSVYADSMYADSVNSGFMSLSNFPALRSFRAITRHYNILTIHTALKTIESLVCLFQAKKEQDSVILREGLQEGDRKPME